METRQIRLQNLLSLASGYDQINRFCEAIDISPSYFSQVKSGKKAIGDAIARRTEGLLGLPPGWLDVLQASDAESMPSDTLGIAYALEGLPERVKSRVKLLILELAVEFTEEQKTIIPFVSTEHAKKGRPVARKKA